MKINCYAVFSYREPHQPIEISHSIKETLEIQRLLKIHGVNSFYSEVDLESLNHLPQPKSLPLFDNYDSDRLLTTFSELSDLLRIEVYSVTNTWGTLKNNIPDQEDQND